MEKKRVFVVVLVLALVLVIISTFLYSEFGKQRETEEKTTPERFSKEVTEEPEETAVGELEIVKEEPKEVVIQILRFEFDKPEVVIEPGTKVIWKNTDTRRHMITNKRIGLFRKMRKSLSYGDTFEYTFNKAGTYEILEANFGINGRVIVKEGNLITGGAVKSVDVNSNGVVLASAGILALTATTLGVGFYVSKKM